MAALPPIDDSNTFPDKTEGGDEGEPTDLVAAADLNALKTVISENREQANDALAAAENAQTSANDAQGTADDALGGIAGAVPAAHTASTKTIASTDFGSIIRLDPTSNAIEVTIPHTLFGSIVSSRSFRFRMVALNVDNAITLAGSGGLGLTYYGDSTITAGDVIVVVIESATVARVEVIKSGDLVGTAQTTATDALHPLVQTAHTSATKTLAAGDAGDIIPLNAASNAIEVTIPHTLFAAGGTGRAWVCQAKVVSVAGGAATFVGSGGIVVEYYGKDPAVDAYIAGDWLTIVVDSATTASVFAVEAL
jgi:hypothetical protein